MDLAKLTTDVAGRLGITATHLQQRFARLVGNLAARIESDLKYDTQRAYQAAVDRVSGMTLREVCLLCAEGPTEQTHALMAPEDIPESDSGRRHPPLSQRERAEDSALPGREGEQNYSGVKIAPHEFPLPSNWPLEQKIESGD